MDCLNTHQSEALVRLVARLEPDQSVLELGIKGTSGSAINAQSVGILIGLVSPISGSFHAGISWMNQIEIWFGILMRKLLKREFCSTEDLKNRF
jgi:putative transposase